MSPELRILEENDRSVYLEVSEILLKILDNILKSPDNPKYRKLRVGNEIISNKLLPAVGAMECLFLFGFEEADDSLVLPQSVSMAKIRQIRDELFQHRSNHVSRTEIKLPTKNQSIASNSFLQEIRMKSSSVLQYEDKTLQALAKTKIPLIELEEKVKKTLPSDGDEFAKEFALLSAAMTWFKTEFFQWMNSPTCGKCNTSSTFQGMSNNPTDLVKTSRVEVFCCDSCNARLLFPRYNNPATLLETRIGRCGEWANCFMLICRTLGYETRYVYDKTDHVWTEVYSNSLKRWIHCDPCEGVIDTPLMYEKGWKKSLSYVIAYSNEEVQDVTWRYTCQFEEVRSRRVECSESDLLNLMLQLSTQLQASLTKERKRYLLERRIQECIEFLTPPTSDGEFTGRSSGSLQWRLSRGESGVEATKLVWRPNKIEIERKRFTIRYSTAKDEYQRVESGDKVAGWQNGVSEMESIMRKVEHDWRMCYLCRSESSASGSMKWSFSTRDLGVAIDRVQIKYQAVTFHGASVRLILCNDKTCIPLNLNDTSVDTDSFKGSHELSLTAVLSGGGSGQDAWQHAQLFRQSIDDGQYLFEVVISLNSDS